jgi:probable F420-dependent oxidoreductase
MARAAEAAGFDSLWVADHMLFRFEGNPVTQGRWEAWSLLSALAAVTQRVEIGPLVSCMSFRNPALLAKMAETVDEISRGRLVLAVGAGWHEPEYRAFGFPFDRRASRFEEGFRIVKELLRSGKSEVRGEFHQLDACEIVPRGPRAGGIPLIVGTNGERLLRLTAREADGWNTSWVSGPEEIAPLRDAVDRACADVGRDPASLARSACVLVALENGDGFPFVPNRPPEPVSEAGAAELLATYAEEGVDHVMVWLDPNTPSDIERFSEALAQLGR